MTPITALKMNSFFAFITTFVFLAGCGGLKSQMVSEPTTQADKDNNAILEYAIANKLKVDKTESGIHYVMDSPGDGAGNPTSSDVILAHYHGTTLDGKIFDSSVDRGIPFKFELGRVIPGWQETIKMLSRGGKGKFMIPSGLAYGTRGAGASIPPNSPLVFEIELIDFAKPGTPEADKLDKIVQEKQMAAYAEQNAKEESVIMAFAKEKNLKLEKTESGVYYHMTKKGTGTVHPTAKSNVTVHYHGYLLDGSVFDSSVDKGKPFTTALNRVIPGWTQGIPVLTEGGKATLVIPSALGYGPRGAGAKIPPNSVLAFDVELIKIN